MDYKFLNRVLDQIVYETRMDYDQKIIYFPFHLSPLSFFSLPSLLFDLFYDHCRDIYGLNEDEVKYVWDEYKRIIENKMQNGL
jgi:hypothetical protein